MKKYLLLIMLAMASICVSAATDVVALDDPALDASPATITFSSSKGKKMTSATAKRDIPASLVGKKFMTYYNNRNNDACNGFYVEADTAVQGGIIIKRFARSYDVKATYDPTTGIITIPTDVVIYKHATYGDFTMYGLNAAAGTYNKEPIYGYVDGDKITFSQGVYVTYTDAEGKSYYVVWMQDMTAVTANAMAELTNATSGTITKLPLVVSRIATDSITMVGLSAYLYNFYTKTPFAMDEKTMTVSQEFKSEFVDYYSTTGNYYLGGTNANGNIVSLSMTADTTANATTITASTMWYVYNTSGNSYNGYKFAPAVFKVDENIFNMDVEEVIYDPDEPVYDGIHYTISRAAHTATVTGCDEGMTTITIPESFIQAKEEYKINAIGDKAFYQNTKITKVEMPAKVRSIGANAFYGCTGLVDFALPSGLWTVGASAFRGCTKIKSLTFPEGIESIGDFAFYGLTSLTGLKFESSGMGMAIFTIGASAFRGCKNIAKLELPSTLSTIGQYSFYECIGLTDLVIPGSLKNIEISAFSSCKALKNITFKSGVRTIQSNAFNTCEALEEVVLPSTLTTIGDGSFNGCKRLKKIDIPSSVTLIDKYAFTGCSALDSVKIAESGLKTIGVGAFDGCSTLSRIYIPWTVTSIGSMAFASCYMLQNIKYLAAKPVKADDDVFENYVYATATLTITKSAANAIKTTTPWNLFEKTAQEEDGIENLAGDEEGVTEIFTLSGLSMGTDLEALPEGVYLVRKGAKVVKVVK